MRAKKKPPEGGFPEIKLRLCVESHRPAPTVHLQGDAAETDDHHAPGGEFRYTRDRDALWDAEIDARRTAATFKELHLEGMKSCGQEDTASRHGRPVCATVIDDESATDQGSRAVIGIERERVGSRHGDRERADRIGAERAETERMPIEAGARREADVRRDDGADRAAERRAAARAAVAGKDGGGYDARIRRRGIGRDGADQSGENRFTDHGPTPLDKVNDPLSNHPNRARVHANSSILPTSSSATIRIAQSFRAITQKTAV